MQAVAPQVAQLTASLVGHAAGSWVGASNQRCICSCEPARLDPGVLWLVQSVVDRCGPEHLHGPPVQPPSRLVSWWLLLGAFCLVLGCRRALPEEACRLDLLLQALTFPSSTRGIHSVTNVS